MFGGEGGVSCFSQAAPLSSFSLGGWGGRGDGGVKTEPEDMKIGDRT